MQSFGYDLVIHRGDSENSYLPVTRKARDWFRTLPVTFGVPCKNARWEGLTLYAPVADEREVADKLADLGLTIGEAIDGEDW